MQVYTTKQVNEVAFEVKNQKAVILPTDTVWGIISLQTDNIYKIKQRSLTKKIVVFVNKIKDIGLPSKYEEVLSKYMPGALTIIYKNNSFRIPASDFILKLIDQTGPVYCSSANISGQDPITSIDQARHVFREHLDKIVFVNDPDFKLSDVPSTIINLDTFKVLRKGTIDGQALINQLKEAQ